MAPGARGLNYLLKHDPGLETSRLRTVLIKAERWRRRDRWRRSLHRLSPRVDRLPLDRPIFVLGIQGGGTTLVTRCLLRHTAAVSMSGNSSYWVATDEIGFVRNRMNRLPKGLWSSAHRFDLEHPLLGTEHASVYGSDLLVDAYRGTAEDATVEDAARFKRLIREHIAVYADDPSHARFVDKTHTYTLKIPYLDQLLAGHDPHFVLVVRNPYTVCFRAVRRKPPSWRRVVPYEEQLRLVAQHWVNSNRRALEDGPATGRFLAVRFEDFVRAPEDVIRAVCDRVGFSYGDALVPRAGDTFPFATLPWDRKWFPLHEDEWRGRVDDDDAAIIEAECRGLADELGYGRRDDGTPMHPAVLRLDGSEPGGAALVA